MNHWLLDKDVIIGEWLYLPEFIHKQNFEFIDWKDNFIRLNSADPSYQSEYQRRLFNPT